MPHEKTSNEMALLYNAQWEIFTFLHICKEVMGVFFSCFYKVFNQGYAGCVQFHVSWNCHMKRQAIKWLLCNAQWEIWKDNRWPRSATFPEIVSTTTWTSLYMDGSAVNFFSWSAHISLGSKLHLLGGCFGLWPFLILKSI